MMFHNRQRQQLITLCAFPTLEGFGSYLDESEC